MSQPNVIQYKDFTLRVARKGGAWRVFIHRPDAPMNEDQVESTKESNNPDACIAEAKLIVDKLRAGS